MEDIVKIIQYFSEVSSKVKLSNKLNLTDNNIYLEDKIQLVLNDLYGWNLRNANKDLNNFLAIDLIDEVNQIVVQVTSDVKTSKIKNTIEKVKQTNYLFYKLYMFYLCDEVPLATKRAIQKYHIRCLCFANLVEEFRKQPLQAKKFLKEHTRKTIRNQFEELLKDKEKWECDGSLYYSTFDPSFRIKIKESSQMKKYAWLHEIKAISKYYSHCSMKYNLIKLFHNEVELFCATSVTFYEEGLSIMIPDNLFLDHDRRLYFDGYFVEREEECSFGSLLTYFFNSKKLSYTDFVEKYRVLTYDKPSYEWVPLIFFQNYEEVNQFKQFLKECIEDFDYEAFKRDRLRFYSLDEKIQDEQEHRICCFHFWIYDLYWNSFKKIGRAY